MSVFIVGDKHYNSVLESISQFLIDAEDLCEIKLEKFFPELFDYDSNDYLVKRNYELESLINKIRELNIETYINKYYDDDPKKADSIRNSESNLILFFSAISNYKELNYWGLYKALRCIKYQIEYSYLDKPLNEESENAMLFLKLMLRVVGEYLLLNSSEYEKEDWEII